MGKRKAEAVSGEPFPDLERPAPAECRAARDALAELHGNPENPAKQLQEKEAHAAVKQASDGTCNTVMDSLARTILSQNTTDTTSHRAFQKLKDSFPTWEEVRTAPTDKVMESIKEGGLAKTKSERLQAILNKLHEEKGECTLEYLRNMTDDDIKAELSRFKGVGSKTIACVLMFCLGSHEFPVDTHVWRIAKNLGWVPSAASREDTYEHLNRRVPDDIKFDLHVLMVEHGKRCERCAKNGKPRKESHGPCPLKKSALSSAKEDPDTAVKAEEAAGEAEAGDSPQDDSSADIKREEEENETGPDVKVKEEENAEAAADKTNVKVEEDAGSNEEKKLKKGGNKRRKT